MNHARTKSRNLLHALELAERRERDLLPADDDEPRSSDSIVMNQQGAIPALEEYIHELAARRSSAS